MGVFSTIGDRLGSLGDRADDAEGRLKKLEEDWAEHKQQTDDLIAYRVKRILSVVISSILETHLGQSETGLQAYHWLEKHKKLDYDNFITADFLALHHELSHYMGSGKIDESKWQALCHNIKQKCDTVFAEIKLE